METLYRKVIVEERLPKEEGDYFTNFGIYHHFDDTPQDQAWWDNNVRFFFEPIEAPDPTAQLQADKAELLEMLKECELAFAKIGHGIIEYKIKSLIQKMKPCGTA